MIEFIKKNKKIILSSSVFIGINSNIYCGCSKGKKCSGEKKGTTSENKDSTTKTVNSDPQKDQNPKGNPPIPGENPQQNEFLQKKQSLLQKIDYLEKLCPDCRNSSTEINGKRVSDEQVYSEKLNKIKNELNNEPDKGNANSLISFKLKIDNVENEIKTTLSILNPRNLENFLKEIESKIKDENKKEEFKQEVNKLSTENNDINNAIKVGDSIKELKKKFYEQLIEEDPGIKDIEDVKTELKNINTSDLTSLLMKIQTEINEESKKKEFDAELSDLDIKNQDINNAKNVSALIKELQKKVDEQINKEKNGDKEINEGDKGADDNINTLRNQVSKSLTEIENLKLKILKKIDLPITNDQITGATTIGELNNIENTLKTKETEINNIINDQNTICSNKDEFITAFNSRKKILAENFNDPVKNNLKNNNPTNDEFNDYYQMYSEMTNDVFNHQIALDLQIFRYILKLEGFVGSLEEIFEKKIQYWFLYLFDKSNANTWKPSVIIISKDNYKIGLNYPEGPCLEVESGDFCVEKEKFKYLRCEEGCRNGNDCISCKLRNLLKNEKCLDDFLKIYKEQGESSSSSEAMLMKRILFTGLKNDKQKLDSYYSTSNECKLDKFKKDVDHKFIKCVMIEWALTIEFMKKFITKYYESDKFNLYRAFGPCNNNFIDLNTIQHDLYESTCLIAPAFVPDNSTIRGHIDEVKLCSFTKTKNHVKYYRCFFNHIISPKNDCILKGDYEHEIGFIGINEKYERISDKTGNDYIKEYNEFLRRATLNNAKKNLPGATISI